MYKKIFTSLWLALVCNFTYGKTIYVAQDANGTNTGLSWENAYTDIQDALAEAMTGDTIWVARGTYYPTDNLDRLQSFQVPNGVFLYGGFEGEEENLAERNPTLHQTILSGDIGERNEGEDNSYNVLFIEGLIDSVLVDGFTIRHGFADSGVLSDSFSSREKSGGGIFVASVSGQNGVLKVANCRFNSNHSAGYGGAIFLQNSVSSNALKATNCRFVNNVAFAGGAVAFQAGAGGNVFTQSVIDSCTFQGNFGSVEGGALFFSSENGLPVPGHIGQYPSASVGETGPTVTSQTAAAIKVVAARVLRVPVFVGPIFAGPVFMGALPSRRVRTSRAWSLALEAVFDSTRPGARFSRREAQSSSIPSFAIRRYSVARLIPSRRAARERLPSASRSAANRFTRSSGSSVMSGISGSSRARVSTPISTRRAAVRSRCHGDAVRGSNRCHSSRRSGEMPICACTRVECSRNSG